jgi:hypothetical protein
MGDWSRPLEAHRGRIDDLGRNPVVLAAIAVALLVPIVLFTFAGFQVALTLLLAPLAGLCIFLAPSRMRRLYFASVAAGALSIALATVVLGDRLVPRYVLSLLLIMTPPLYFFLGRYLAFQSGFERLLLTLAAVSTGFVSLLVIQVVTSGTQVRWYIGPEGLTVLNLDFLGLPIYGTFGVLSLASLFVLQMFTIGAAFIASTRRWQQVLFLIGFGAAVFLILGSNARGVQLVLPYLLVVLGAAWWFGSRVIRIKVGILLAVVVLSVAYSASRMIEPIRIVTTLEVLVSQSARDEDARQARARAAAQPGRIRAIAVPESGEGAEAVNWERLSTGRESLLEDSLTEVLHSPIFGTGFASFGRIDPNAGAREVKATNRTTHVYYLTILWKGGVIFFVPYMALMVAFWMPAVRRLRAAVGEGAGVKEEQLFLAAALPFLFTILSITWDILLVPSAGAFGFFILGALAEPRP